MSSNSINTCPLCTLPLIVVCRKDNPVYEFNCSRCGKFFVTKEFYEDPFGLKELIQNYRAILSGCSREAMICRQKPLEWEWSTVDQVRCALCHNISYNEKIKKLLNYIYLNTKTHKDDFYIDYENDFPITYSSAPEELKEFIREAEKNELLIAHPAEKDKMVKVTLTLKGREFIGM